MGIRALASQLNKWLATSVWLGNLLATVVVILVIRPDVPSLLCTPARFTEEKMGGHPFLGAQVVAEQVSQLTSPDDFVFVAGSEPQILYYTRRFSPTRFTTLAVRAAEGFRARAPAQPGGLGAPVSGGGHPGFAEASAGAHCFCQIVR